MRRNNDEALALAIVVVGGLVALAIVADFIATYFVIIIAISLTLIILAGLGALLWILLRR